VIDAWFVVFSFSRFNPAFNMATIRQAINETIERGISKKPNVFQLLSIDFVFCFD
jgi:hypothetical protein